MAETLVVQLSAMPARIAVVSPGGEPAQAAERASGPSDDALAARDKLMDAERNDLKLARLALESGLSQVHRMEGEQVRSAEQQLLDLAVEIARKVLMQEIQAERYDIDPIVQEALRRAPGSKDIVVRMHPADLARCKTAGAAAGQGVRFTADPTIKRAECVVETQQGHVVSSIESHLQTIASAVRSPQ